MAAFTTLEKMALEAPELAGSSVTKNGVTFTLTELFTNLLDSNGGVFELAMANLFQMLATADRNQSLTLGEFSFSRRTGMSFDDRRFYWERRHRANAMGAADAVPTIAVGMPWAAVPPAVR